MTKKLPVENQCYGKTRHRTPAKAHQAKAALGYTGIDIYRCGHCGFWHVGNTTPRQRIRATDEWHSRHRNWRVWVAGE